MINIDVDEGVFNKFQQFLKEETVKENNKSLRNNASKFFELFWKFTTPVSSPRGYNRPPYYSDIKVEPPLNKPQFFSAWVHNEVPEEFKEFYQYLPLSLIKKDEKVELNAWMVAQAWGWMHVGKAIRKIYEYDYETWREDWCVFWGRLSKHIAEYGLFNW